MRGLIREKTTDMSYDYIVVGTGAAGSVLAEQLSASGKNSVLVVEAGGSDRNPLHLVPKGFQFTMGNKRYTRQYRTEPFGGADEGEDWPRGVVLGGSTTINGAAWNRGEPWQYDAWEERGLTGWNWKSFKAAFEAIEDRRHGPSGRPIRRGRMTLENGRAKNSVSDAFQAAAAREGVRAVEDSNDIAGDRVSYGTFNTRRGLRMSASRAFLRPALKRKNVTLRTRTEVTRVLFNGRRAIGVEAETRGRTVTYFANKEVVLAAGALESPLVLERSGIGRPEVLRAVGVEVLAESPNVGEKLSEHRGFTLMYRLHDGLGYNSQISTPLRQLMAGAKFLLSRRGVIAVGGFDTWAMLQIDPGAPGADAQVFFTPISYGANRAPDKERAGGLIGGYPMFPTSRGSIHITGKRLSDKPRLVASFYQTDHDRGVLTQLVRTLRSYIESPEMKALGAVEYMPGATVSTDEEIVNFATAHGGLGYHPLGACAMGTADDDVLDERCRVRGVGGLRVVDASIFRDQPSGNNSAATSAAAWIASRMIQEDNS